MYEIGKLETNIWDENLIPIKNYSLFYAIETVHTSKIIHIG